MPSSTPLILSLPLDLLLLLFFFTLSLAVGEKILEKLGLSNFPNTWLKLIFSSAIGWILFSWITFAAGMIGGLYRWIFILIFLILLICSWRNFINALLNIRRLPALIGSIPQNKFEWLLLTMIGLAVMSNLIYCYAPPTQVRELLYDLNLPKMYLQAHKIYDAPDRHLAYFPLQIQMLYLMALTVKGTLLAKLFHYFFGLLSLGLLYLTTKHLFKSKAALYASTLFYLTPLVTSLSSAANIDLGTLFYGLLTTSALLFWVQNKSPRSLYLAAFLAGITSSTKVSGVAMALTALIFIILGLLKIKQSLITSLKQFCFVLIFIFLGVSPWIFKNVYFTGNPLMPYSVPFLGLQGHESALIEIELCKKTEQKLKFKDYLEGYHNFLYGGFIYGPGPLLFAFMLPSLFIKKIRKKIFIIGGLATINYILLNSLLRYPHRFYETRYFCISYGLISIISGVGLDIVLSQTQKHRLLKLLIFLLLFFPCLSFSLHMSLSRLPVFVGLKSQSTFLEEELRNYPLVVYGNKLVPANSKILILLSGDPHYALWNARIIDPLQFLLREKDSNKVLDHLKEIGITHILFNREEYPKQNSQGIWEHSSISEYDLYWDVNGLTQQTLHEIYRFKSFILYEIDYMRSPQTKSSFGEHVVQHS